MLERSLTKTLLEFTLRPPLIGSANANESYSLYFSQFPAHFCASRIAPDEHVT